MCKISAALPEEFVLSAILDSQECAQVFMTEKERKQLLVLFIRSESLKNWFQQVLNGDNKKTEQLLLNHRMAFFIIANQPRIFLHGTHSCQRRSSPQTPQTYTL